MSRKDFLLLVLGLMSMDRGIAESRVKLTKILFILQEELGRKLNLEEPYSFEWYLHGPFSKQILDDLDELESQGLIHIIEENKGSYIQYNFMLTERGKKKLETLLRNIDKDTLREISTIVKKFNKMSAKEIKKYVYEHYMLDF